MSVVDFFSLFPSIGDLTLLNLIWAVISADMNE